MGFVWGRWSHYGLAVLYPLVVLGAIAFIGAAAGAIDFAAVKWKTAFVNLGLIGLSTVVGALITEEGFFRGWLWAALERSGQSQGLRLIWTSLAFSLWHWSAVALPTPFALPAGQIPVFLANVVLIGLIWGLMRALSGSVIVTSVSHGVWNGGAYALFGLGTKVGALGIQDTAFYGPEVGVLGLALNLAFAAALWGWWRTRAGLASDSFHRLPMHSTLAD
jgi:membrane protease YdiL (CAAX protease family)